MVDHRDPKIAGPAPTAPKKPLPGQDAYFPGQPPIGDIDERLRGPKQPTRSGRSEDKEKPDDSAGDHIESAEHVERELPVGAASRDR